MKLLTFKRITSTVIRIIIFTVFFLILYKAGIAPLWAAIGIVMLKSIIRFIFRLSVLLVSIAIIFLFITLLICI